MQTPIQYLTQKLPDLTERELFEIAYLVMREAETRRIYEKELERKKKDLAFLRLKKFYNMINPPRQNIIPDGWDEDWLI